MKLLASDNFLGSDFISIASNVFEPGKFVARAVDAAKEYITSTSHGGIDDALLGHTAADVEARGLTALSVTLSSASGTRASGTPGPF